MDGADFDLRSDDRLAGTEKNIFIFLRPSSPTERQDSKWNNQVLNIFKPSATWAEERLSVDF